MRENYGRWSVEAVAAAYAMPAETCETAAEWERLIDRLDRAIEFVLATQ